MNNRKFKAHVFSHGCGAAAAKLNTYDQIGSQEVIAGFDHSVDRRAIYPLDHTGLDNVESLPATLFQTETSGPCLYR